MWKRNTALFLTTLFLLGVVDFFAISEGLFLSRASSATSEGDSNQNGQREDFSRQGTFHQPDGFRLNQFELERKLQKIPFSSRPPADAVIKELNPVSLSFDLPSSISWDNPKSVFEYVYFRIPDHAVVYPTETYYYYSFDTGQDTVAGNFRFVDAADGVLHIGYFNEKDPRSALGGSQSFTAQDGVLVETPSPHLVRVTYQNVVKHFSLNPTATLLPKSLRLLPDEVFISRIFDESGFEFALLFNEVTNAFYYVTNDELSFPDEKVSGPRNYVLGKNSSFVFYDDAERERLLLVGVHEKHIFMNTYYDGPFDQVPPRLNIRDRIYRAYPYTRWRGGIDEHGNFLTTKDTRVAISPYHSYRALSALYENQSRCFEIAPGESDSASALLSCLAYEWKMDFHKWGNEHGGDPVNADTRLRFADSEAPIFVKQGWPANHYVEASTSWPAEHLAPQSRSLPANFSFGHEDTGFRKSNTVVGDDRKIDGHASSTCEAMF